MDEPEFEMMQPALASKHITAKSGMICEIDHGFYTLIQNFYGDLVAIGVDDPTIACCKAEWHTAC